MTGIRTLIVLCLAMNCGAMFACTHALQVKNSEMYATTLQLGTQTERRPFIAVTPFNGTPDELWFFNAIIERLNQDPAIGDLRTDYIPRLGERAGIEPDIVVSIRPLVKYRSSGWNFLVNWPGFLIFTPAWNGYVYHADVMTEFTFRDRDGTVLDQLEVPVSYSLRHADMDRTIWTGLTWLEVSALALIGGIYNANVFDRDVIAPMQVQVKDNYSNYVLAQAQKRIQSIAATLNRRPEQLMDSAVGAGPPATPAGEEAPTED